MRLAPSSPDSYTYYARSLIAHSRPTEARPLLQHTLELSPADNFAHELMAKTDTPMNNQAPNETPEFYLQRSLQLYNEGRYAECIASSRRALEVRPNYAEAWNNIGAAYNKLDRYQEAVAACEQALRYKPDFHLAGNNLQYARHRLNLSSK